MKRWYRIVCRFLQAGLDELQATPLPVLVLNFNRAIRIANLPGKSPAGHRRGEEKLPIGHVKRETGVVGVCNDQPGIEKRDRTRTEELSGTGAEPAKLELILPGREFEDLHAMIPAVDNVCQGLPDQNAARVVKLSRL